MAAAASASTGANPAATYIISSHPTPGATSLEAVSPDAVVTSIAEVQVTKDRPVPAGVDKFIKNPGTY